MSLRFATDTLQCPVIVMQSQCSSFYLVCCGFSCPLGTRSHCLHFVIYPPKESVTWIEINFPFFVFLFLFFFFFFWFVSDFLLAEEHGILPDYHKVLSQHQCSVYFQTWRIPLNSECEPLQYEKEKKNSNICLVFFLQKLYYWCCGRDFKKYLSRFIPQFCK